MLGVASANSAINGVENGVIKLYILFVGIRTLCDSVMNGVENAHKKKCHQSTCNSIDLKINSSNCKFVIDSRTKRLGTQC